MYKSESKGSKDSTITVSYKSKGWPVYNPPVTRTETFGMLTTSEESQYGWRGPRNADTVSVQNSDGYPSGTNWGGAGGTQNAISRIERASTPDPLVRDSSLPVHDRIRTVRSFKPRDGSIGTIVRPYGSSSFELEGKYRIGPWNDSWGYFPVTPISASIKQDLLQDLDDRLRASRPTKPAFGLTRALIELKDFPKLVSQMSDLLRLKSQNPGSSYLGYQFGMAPMISDVRAAAKTIATTTERLAQFARDSGRLVRRSVQSTKTESADVGYDGVLYWASSNDTIRPYWSNQYVETVTTYTARAFTLYEYFVGDPNEVYGRLGKYVQRADALLATNLTPDIMWEVTPWSWLIDWFVDIGSLLAFQQDVADYSLAMRRSGWSIERRTTHSFIGDLRWAHGDGNNTYADHVASTGFSKVYERRPGASPGGLTTGWGELSSFQLSIFAALGLQRYGRR